MEAWTYADECIDLSTGEPLQPRYQGQWGFFIPDEALLTVAWPNIRGKKKQLEKAYATVRAETKRQHADGGKGDAKTARFDPETTKLVPNVANKRTYDNAARHQQGIAVKESMQPLGYRSASMPLPTDSAYDPGLWDDHGSYLGPAGSRPTHYEEFNFTNSFTGFWGGRGKKTDPDFDELKPSRFQQGEYLEDTRNMEGDERLMVADRLGRFGPDRTDDRLPESVRGTFVPTSVAGAASQYAQAGGAKGWADFPPNRQPELRTPAARRAQPSSGRTQVTQEEFASSRYNPSSWDGVKGKNTAPQRDDDILVFPPAPVAQPKYQGKGPLPDHPFRDPTAHHAFKPSKAETKGTGKGYVYGVGGKGKSKGKYGWHHVPPWKGSQSGSPYHKP